MTDGKQAAGPARHAPLIVWCAAPQAGEPILEVLRHGFELDLRPGLPEIGAADGTTGEAADILLLCLSPAETLYRAMQGGVVPATALKGWLEQTRAMLQLNRGNRRKVRILDIQMAARHPRAFLRRFNLPEDKSMIADLVPDRQSDKDAILQLMAMHTLLGDVQARALTGELAAASLSFSDAPDRGAENLDTAFLSYRESRQFQEQATLLQAQNRAVQTDMGALGQHKLQLEQRLEQTSQGLESYRVQVNELRSEISELKGKVANKEAGLQQAGAQLIEHEQELHQLRASRSWRLTAPLRGIRRMMSRRKQA